jgi:hypothetical protein
MGLLSSGSINWGDAPTWVAATLSSFSVLLALYILLGDRRKENRKQAVQVVFTTNIFDYSSERGEHYVITLVNRSPYPIYSPKLVLTRLTIRQLKRKFPGNKTLQAKMMAVRPGIYERYFQAEEDTSSSRVAIVDASSKATTKFPIEMEIGAYRVGIEFDDTDGHRWSRDVLTGDLQPVTYRRVTRMIKRQIREERRGKIPTGGLLEVDPRPARTGRWPSPAQCGR